MRMFLPLVAIALSTMPALAAAQEGDRNSLAGPKVGVEIIRDVNETRQALGALTASRKGFGVRAFAGYDAVIGGIGLVGGEIGIGKGGRTTDQTSLLGGRFRVDPGLTYDATVRLGIIPTSGLVIYGRGGYRWLQVKRSLVSQTVGNGDVKSTEKGFTYGGGIEYAISPNLAFRVEGNRTEYDKDFIQNRVSVGASYRF
jgi:outer membrane immunogenic protein